MIAYKFLRADGTGVFTRFPWPLPGEAPGAWVEAPIVACHSGVHACRRQDLPLWLGRELYEVELDGRIVEEPATANGPASIGFIAARIAEARDGLDGYHAERGRQVAWLEERLGL